MTPPAWHPRSESQRVAFVLVTAPTDDPDVRLEAVQVNLGLGSGIPADDLIDGALAVVAPRFWLLEENRRQINWGATGLHVQDVLVLYGATTAAELTVAAILAGLMKLSKVAFHGRQVKDADAAWAEFEAVLRNCSKVTEATALQIAETEDGWTIDASARGRTFEGHVAKNGRVVQARRRGVASN